MKKPLFNIILYQPEIPPNTGNIIRLCANIGASLHLIEPMGFTLENKKLRRAGLDYHEFAEVEVHASLGDCLAKLPLSRVFACSTRGKQLYHRVTYQAGDSFLFGPETRGLPQDILDNLPAAQMIKIPMQPQQRSLNLSNAVAVIAYEAWRQQGFGLHL